MPYSCSAHRNLPINGIWVNSLLDAENEYEYDANFMDIIILPLSLNFRRNGSSPVGKFERHLKDHLSMSVKIKFHILRRNRNDTFLRAFVNSLPFSGICQAAQCQRPYSKPRVRGSQVKVTSPAVAHTPTDRARTEAPRRWPRLVSTVSGNIAHRRGNVNGEKRHTYFSNARKNVSFPLH